MAYIGAYKRRYQENNMTEWEKELSKAYQRGYEDNTKLNSYIAGFVSGVVIYIIGNYIFKLIGG